MTPRSQSRCAVARDERPVDMMREVRAVVHAEWRKVVATRRQRRTFMFVAAASICAIAVGVIIGLQLMNDASEVAPAFVIENASLASFLRWIARETGRALVYQSPSVQTAAASIVLHGSIEGLTRDVALTAVLEKTSLRRDETKPEVIEIVFAAAIDSGSSRRPTR